MTTTATTTVAINPAFLEEIKDDHRDLWTLLNRIRAVCAAGMKDHGGRQLVDMLEDLRDRLAMHFTLEEAYGYFDDAIWVAPHISENAERLRAQHVDLYREICDVADLAEALRYQRVSPKTSRQVTDAFDQFHGRLIVHEGEERRLLMSAYFDDIGVGD